MTEPTLVLIDGHALIYRAYHAIPPLNTRTGQTTNAVFGFITMLLKALDELKPAYVAVAFDPPGPTFRHEEYKPYKAHRPTPGDDLRSQFALVRRVVQTFNIPAYEVSGYEADDVLGTLARQATAQDVDTVIVTGDLDTLQLVDDHVRVYTTKGHFSDTITYDAPAVRERYGLEPNQLADYRGLKGDPSDNIPGVKGVGDKTATRLLQQFGTVAGVYEHLDEVPPAARKKLAGQEDQARQSAHLATIVTDVPVTLDLAACRVTEYDRDAVLELFRELEFRSLVDRLPGGSPPPPSERPVQMSLFGDETPVEAGKTGAAFSLAPTRADATSPVVVIVTAEGLAALAGRLAAGESFCVDVETTSPDAMTADLVGIALAPAPDETYYLPIGHPVPPEQLSLNVVQRHLGPVLADPAIGKVAHNAKYDVTVLIRHGMPVAGTAYDTMIAAYLLCEKGLGLKDLSFTRLGVEMTPITDLIGKGKSQITMAQVPVASSAPYAGADVEMTLRLREFFTPRLHEEGVWDLFHDVEMPLVHVLTVMEMNGVLIDTNQLAAFS
ncbi:MAG: DNA polymerase I, partial [Chloroflexi bacterium]|nr:DNA polymerase I [Chloroflexota bacterium]